MPTALESLLSASQWLLYPLGIPLSLVLTSPFVGNLLGIILPPDLFCNSIELLIWLLRKMGLRDMIYYIFIAMFTSLFVLFGNPPLNGESFYRTPENQLRSQYDFIIVGGGTAGCLLANRLSANPSVSVLLIEAGGVPNIFSRVPALIHGNQNNPVSQLDWGYLTEAQVNASRRINNHRVHLGSGRGLGGSSHINFQIFSRPHKEDFDRWQNVFKASGWNSTTLWKYMTEYENMLDAGLANNGNHGTKGELQVKLPPTDRTEDLVARIIEKAAEVTNTEELKDYNAGVGEGFGRIQLTVNEDGYSSNSVRSFIDPIRELRKDNLHIILYSMVKEVTFNGTRATGVVVEGEKSSIRSFSCRLEVILSAGSAGSPQILMLSGIGPQEHLKQHKIPVRVNSPGVGANLHDHYQVIAPVALFPDGKGFRDFESKELWKLVSGRGGMLQAPGGEIAIGFIKTPNATDNRPNVEILIFSASPNRETIRTLTHAVGMADEDADKYLSAGRTTQGIFLQPIILHSPTRGNVTLRTTDIKDHPVFNLQYFQDQIDLDTIVDALQTSRRIIESLDYKSSYYIPNIMPGCEQFENDTLSRQYVECVARAFTISEWHMSGTCAIGGEGSPVTPVVDSQLRVIGTSGLRVVDASIFPEQLSSHMVAAVYCVASMAADLIKEANGIE